MQKRYLRKTGKSISRMFEDKETESQKSEPQMAAERLLNQLKSAIPVRIRHDKQLLKVHAARKYA